MGSTITILVGLGLYTLFFTVQRAVITEMERNNVKEEQL
jgi:hypothetical protein